MKKNMIVLAIGIVLLLGVVWLGTLIVPNDAGMLFTMALLFVANPIYFVFVGITAGKCPAKSWYIPIIAVAIFVGTYIIVLDMKEWIYPTVYLALAYVSMWITWIAGKPGKRAN